MLSSLRILSYSLKCLVNLQETIQSFSTLIEYMQAAAWQVLTWYKVVGRVINQPSRVCCCLPQSY